MLTSVREFPVSEAKGRGWILVYDMHVQLWLT